MDGGRPSILVARRIFPEVLARLRKHFEVESNDDNADRPPTT